MSYILALTTTSGMETAKKIAKTLVDERLAACVNIIPYVKSFYVWEGKTTEDDECLLIIKTHIKEKENLIRRIRELHPYTVPEIIIINFNDGLPEYLKWISESVKRNEN
ncbi:divalent-cation tolerance protein CutA [Sulfurisphaera javensis]|uniref:Divalent-cation tolerance protein CutA n=1 Tax=Sulfurisphaera javensis TaxID=2049879 RepID=A0AAT9GUG1_9CREN